MIIQNLSTKEIIEPEDRLTYALNRCGIGIINENSPDFDWFVKEIIPEFLDLFYSGNYVETEEPTDEPEEELPYGYYDKLDEEYEDRRGGWLWMLMN